MSYGGDRPIRMVSTLLLTVLGVEGFYFNSMLCGSTSLRCGLSNAWACLSLSVEPSRRTLDRKILRDSTLNRHVHRRLCMPVYLFGVTLTYLYANTYMCSVIRSSNHFLYSGQPLSIPSILASPLGFALYAAAGTSIN